MSEPYELSAGAAAAAIASRQLSSIDLLRSLVARIETLDGAVQAWVRVATERATLEARACEAEAVQGRLRGALHGVPFGVKDIYLTEGLITEAGSPIYHGFLPAHDAACIVRLKAAGAIILGKTHTTQFAMGDPAPTRNPWNLDHTPGGSSSGSAAAVAARMVPLALGTQTAGSVLRPAAFCGVVGFKPSAGRYSTEGIIPLARTLDHAGTLTRCVSDARLLFSVLGERREMVGAAAIENPPRLNVLFGPFLDRAAPDALDNFRTTVQRLGDAGGALGRVNPSESLELMLEVHHLIMASEAAAYHAGDFVTQPDAYRPNLRALIESGSLIPATAYLRAQELRNELTSRIGELFKDHDAVLMPAALGVAPAGLTSTGDPAFNTPWSLAGLPAVSIPAGLSADGLPFGLQVVGRIGDDAHLLDVAEWCEQVLVPLPLPAGIAQSA
jgi:aspartyl-tRNA(Asn)/glutamyl-tRNA(Gln) amidotransferase subunit A